MTVRLYTRVSSQVQVDGFSLDFQREKGEAWAQFQQLRPVRLYEERGISGTRDDRPELTALLNDLTAGDTVLVYSLSRLGRGGVVQLLGITSRIREAGARLVSLTESVDTESYTGRLMLTILAALAEMEIETTRERTMSGRLQAAAQGIFPHNSDSLPFGYARGEDGRIVAGDRADDLRLIFRLAAGGTAYNAVATELNARGIPSKAGGRWTATTVMRIIQADSYHLGAFNYREDAYPDNPEAWIPLPCPPLITPAEWKGAQRDRTHNHPKRRPDLYPLTRRIRCTCGAPLQGSVVRAGAAGRKTDWYYYACRQESRPGRPLLCPAYGKRQRTYERTRTEERARAALLTALRDPRGLARLAAPTDPPADPHSEERARLTERRAALIDLHLDGLIDRPEFVRRREELDTRLTTLTPPPAPAPADAPDGTLYATLIEQATPEEYLALLDLLDVQFQIVPDGVEVTRLTMP